jgi:hypothetical protein
MLRRCLPGHGPNSKVTDASCRSTRRTRRSRARGREEPRTAPQMAHHRHRFLIRSAFRRQIPVACSLLAQRASVWTATDPSAWPPWFSFRHAFTHEQWARPVNLARYSRDLHRPRAA